MGHPGQEQTRTLLPSTNHSGTPVDSRQSRYTDKCGMHKLLFAVVHLLLDKASCYILDKSEETPFASKTREYGRVASRNRVSDHFSVRWCWADSESKRTVFKLEADRDILALIKFKATTSPVWNMPQQRYTGFFQLSLSLWSRDYPPLALEISVVLLAIREELRDLLKLEKKKAAWKCTYDLVWD